MNVKNMKLPIIIIAIGLILAIVACFLTGMEKEPVIKEHEFNYSVTYKIDGEIKTYEGAYKCNFIGHEGSGDPTVRLYEGVHTKDGKALNAFWFPIAQNGEIELSVVVDLNPAYLMGDPDKYEYDPGNEDPYLEALRDDDYPVEVSEFFDAEIISWDYPEPIENSFKLVGFSRLYAISMFVMLLIAVLTLIACAIFARRDKDVSYKLFDKLSIIANFIIGLVVIPFISIVIFFFPLVMDEEAFLYQIYLCLPALSVFAIALSVAFRRKGFTKSGFLVQFVFPALFFIEIFVESLIYNFFS